MHLHNLKCILNTAEVKIDICTECKAKKIYRKDPQERIDNEKYRKDHQRQYLQPKDKLYTKYYTITDPFAAHKKVQKEFEEYQESLERRKLISK